MATHSSILAWEFTGTEEPGRLQSMDSQRAGHNLATKSAIMGVNTELPLWFIWKIKFDIHLNPGTF